MYKSTKKTFCYYFIFSYTDKHGADKQTSFVTSNDSHFPFKDALEKCSKKEGYKGIITFFTRITQEEHTDYLSYVDSL